MPSIDTLILAFKNAPYSTMLINTAEDTILFLNDRFIETIGYTKEDIPTVKKWMTLAHREPRTLAHVEETWAIHTAEGKSRNIVFPIVCKNLSTRIIEFQSAFLPDDLAIVTLNDVTLREREQAALEESEARFQSVYEQAAVGISLCSPDGRLISINPMLCNITGYTSAELEGKAFIDLIYPEDREQYLDNLEILTETPHRRVQAERRLITKAGHLVWISLTATMVLDTAGNPKHIVSILTDVTERKRAESELNETRAILEAAFEQTSAGMVIVSAPEGIILHANQAALDILGENENEIVGTTISNLTLGKRLLRPDTTQMSPEDDPLLRAIGKGETAANSELGFVRKDGSVRWILANTAAFRNQNGKIIGAVAVFPDITEIKESQKALRESEERYRSIFNNVLDGYYRTDQTGYITMANPAAVRMLGFETEEELLGTNVFSLLTSTPDRAGLTTRLLSGNKITNIRLSLMRKDGSEIDIEVESQIIRDIDSGETIGFEGIFRDLTEHKRTRELMIQTEKMMSIGGMAAGMAHEINNPLGIILQGAEGLERRVSPDLPGNKKVADRLGLDLEILGKYLEERGISGYVKGIRDAGKRAASIIRNMLNFSRHSDTGKIPTDLNELIENTIELASNDYDLKKQFDFRRIQIIKELDFFLPKIVCNRTEIEQVLLNLLRNAAQAVGCTPECGKQGTVTLRTGLSQDGRRVIVEVEDNGPGLTEPEIKRALEPFYTTKEPGVGTGLGLSVSYFIVVQNHDGEFRLESPEHGGLKVIFELPLDSQLEPCLKQ